MSSLSWKGKLVGVPKFICYEHNTISQAEVPCHFCKGQWKWNAIRTSNFKVQLHQCNINPDFSIQNDMPKKADHNL
jgi:hypothetical protein